MHSIDDADNGAPVGRTDGASAPVARRTSSAVGSPGTDSTVKRLDLNVAFIRHPDATFMVRAAGQEMSGAGIDSGDVLLVDRARKAQHGSVVIAVVAGELRCRLLEQPTGGRRRPGVMRLSAADPAVLPIIINDDTPLEV